MEIIRDVENYTYPIRTEPPSTDAESVADAEKQAARADTQGLNKVPLKATMSKIQAENTALREELDSLRRVVSDLKHTVEEDGPLLANGRLPSIKLSGSLTDMMYVMFGFVMLSGGFAISIAFRWLQRPRR